MEPPSKEQVRERTVMAGGPVARITVSSLLIVEERRIDVRRRGGGL